MTRTRFTVFSFMAVASGLAAAWLVAPMLTAPPDAGGMIAMWASSYTTIGAMAQDADAVIVATVEDVQPGRQVPTSGGAGVLPFTLAEMNVEKVIRGRAPERIVVEQTGGEIDDRTLYVEGDGGLYVPGERVVLFLKKQQESDFYYLTNPQGRFGVEGGRLRAVAPEDPVAQQLDTLPLDRAMGLIRSSR